MNIVQYVQTIDVNMQVRKNRWVKTVLCIATVSYYSRLISMMSWAILTTTHNSDHPENKNVYKVRNESSRVKQ